MEKYLIFRKTSETNREYIYQISRNSVSTQDDIGYAIEFDNRELAISMATYLTNRDSNGKKYFVLSMITTTSILESEEK